MGTFVQNSAQGDEHIFRSWSPDVRVPDNITLPEFVLQNAELYAGNVAFVEAVTGKKITYGKVVRDTRRFAKALRSLGLKKGQVVVVVLPNVAEYAIVALGIMAAGGVFSGSNPSGHASEIKKQVEVAPAELEAILLCHPSVEDVAVVTEIPAASVVIAAGAKESEEEIINYVASNVAQYKKVSSALCGHSTKITLREGHEKACQREHDKKIKASKLHCLN
ncbi:hypothetical protein C1H46_042670 [Malus baccata]|uniref:AMP-dependent synthetase/ligase domain-containing protein n=1 Tax=Malus baccata TaxID=106549 RepID=A0A540KCW8_MALBA|nr:hypothetical protein C1H46_042670 [Malus baccata]